MNGPLHSDSQFDSGWQTTDEHGKLTLFHLGDFSPEPPSSRPRRQHREIPDTRVPTTPDPAKQDRRYHLVNGARSILETQIEESNHA